MCPKCNGSLIRDIRSSEPPYCLQCGYVLIKAISINEGTFTHSINYEAMAHSPKTVNMDDYEL